MLIFFKRSLFFNLVSGHTGRALIMYPDYGWVSSIDTFFVADQHVSVALSMENCPAVKVSFKCRAATISQSND